MTTPRIEAEIQLNRISQGHVTESDGLSWFLQFSELEQRDILRLLAYMVLQAHVAADDITQAVQLSGIKRTTTCCVLLLRGIPKVQLAKAIQLPKNELNHLFQLLIAILRQADRRRKIQCGNDCNHWWHRDLGEQDVIDAIRREYRDGTL